MNIAYIIIAYIIYRRNIRSSSFLKKPINTFLIQSHIRTTEKSHESRSRMPPLAYILIFLIYILYLFIGASEKN